MKSASRILEFKAKWGRDSGQKVCTRMRDASIGITGLRGFGITGLKNPTVDS